MNDINNKHHEGEVTIEEARSVQVDARNTATMGTPAAIIVGAALIAGALYFGLKAQSASPAPVSNTGDGNGTVGTEQQGPVNVTEGDLPVYGNPSAPVTLVEWADFQCPFCGRFHKDVESAVRDKYINSGKVKWAYRDFAFLGQESTDAAIAARCANEQGKFWQYHDKLFASQNGENEGAFSRDNLKGFARDLGLNASQFNNCLDSNKYADAVEKDTATGRAAGVNGTPTSFINGRIVNGAQPFSAVQQIIEDELKK